MGSGEKTSAFARGIKRSLDLMVCVIAAPLLLPVAVVVTLLVRIKMGSPVLFRQTRPGLGAKPFVLLKFRTMNTARDAQGRLLSDEKRLTTLGRTLRRFSLDEIPQLWNVLKGEMSVVGPRPLLTQYLARYSPEQARRHKVKPGITGWAQVNGRNAHSWEERFQQDVWYVDHLSLWLDVKIMAKTLRRVYSQEGVAQEGHATMPEFMGDHRAR